MRSTGASCAEYHSGDTALSTASNSSSTPVDAWDPAQYERFRAQRSQPFYDLMAMVELVPGGRAIDLGCGTGELTRELHQAKQFKSTVGLDNSEAMLEKAAEQAGSGLTFRLGTFLRLAPRTPFDVVFSNAALQWAPEHEHLFARLTAALKPGGQLAVQMPANHDHLSHITADGLALEEPFFSAMGGHTRQWPVQPPEWYAHLLFKLGYHDINIRLQIYPHELPSRADVVEWVKGTYLTEYRSRMPAETYALYLERYTERLLPLLADDRPFLYPYKRILMHAHKGG